MTVVRQKLAHLWERDENDWYVEPYECSASLFSMESFVGRIWDPACGLGRIVESAQKSGHDSFGTDLIWRSSFCSYSQDFVADFSLPEFSNIVTNPPFSLAELFVRKSLDILPIGGKLAVILPLVWISGFSTKRNWLPRSPLKTVYPISPRPSMPPGKVIEAGIKPGNGTKDFAWLVWENGYVGDASVRFMNTNDLKRSNITKHNDLWGGKLESTVKRTTSK